MFRARRASLVLLLLLANACCGRTQDLSQNAARPAEKATDLFNYDRSAPLGAEVVAAEDRPEYKSFKLSYASANSERVPGFFVLPATLPAGKIPCVILMHGLGQDKKALSMLWGTFAKSGYAVLAIDAQFHGDRAPKTAIELFGTAIEPTRSLLIQTVIDLRRALDYIETRKEIDPKRIGYVGFSMGGILGTLLCAVDDRVQAPIIALAGGNWKLMSETSTLAQAIKARQAQGADPNGWQLLDPLDPVRFVARISPRPVLFINGDNDTVVPVACAKQLHEAAGPGKEIFMYKSPNGSTRI
jgi:uncharacterized protein